MIWSLSVLTREPIEERQAAQIIGGLATIFGKLLHQQQQHPSIFDALNDGLWVFSSLSTFHAAAVDACAQSNIIPHLARFLVDSPMDLKIKLVLRTLGNLVAGTDAQTQLVIDSGILDKLRPRLLDDDWEIQREAAWIAANIVSGNEQQVDALVETGILEDLARVAMGARWSVRKEAIWALSTLCTGHGSKHILALVEVNGLLPLVNVLNMENPDEDMTCEVLDALRKVLDVMGTNGRRLIEECNGHDFLGEFVLEYPSETATKKASDILQLFFNDDAMEEEEENIAPHMTGDMFSFGLDDASMGTTFDFSK